MNLTRSFLSRFLAFASVLSFSFSSARAAEIVAHRGASYDAPENTLAAVKLGFEQKADAVEIDIHLTKDGKIAVLHDMDTKRVGGANKKVAEQTLDELRALEVGAWGQWTNKGFSEKIPTLAETLSLVPKGKRLFIEIKCGPEIIPALAQDLALCDEKPEQLVIITFRYDSARAAKQQFPRQKVYLLHSWAKDKATGEFPQLSHLIQKAKDAKLDGLDLNYNFPIDAAAAQQIRDAGLEWHAWTVDDAAKGRELAALGVASITTNRPEWLREQLRSK